MHTVQYASLEPSLFQDALYAEISSLLDDEMSVLTAEKNSLESYYAEVYDRSTIPLTFITLEGAIGAGKSTALEAISKTFGNFVIIQAEPIAEWQEAGAFQAMSNKTLSEETFQFMVLTSVLHQTLRSIEAAKQSGIRIIVAERSLASTLYIFARRAIKSETARKTFLYAWNCAMGCIPTNVAYEHIYIEALPQTCMDRIAKRNRSGEEHLTQEDLENLVHLHDRWLKDPADYVSCRDPVVSINSEDTPAHVAAQTCAAVQKIVDKAYAKI